MFDEKWNGYLEYLREWAKGHEDSCCKGMSPSCYEEWLECEEDEDFESTFIVNCPTKDIVDSMQLDSGTNICTFKGDCGMISIDVQGEVKVGFKGDTDGFDVYRYPSEFPKELKWLIKNMPYKWSELPMVDNMDNNWFELFVYDNEGNVLTSDVIDVEGDTCEALYELCREVYIDEFIK